MVKRLFKSLCKYTCHIFNIYHSVRSYSFDGFTFPPVVVVYIFDPLVKNREYQVLTLYSINPSNLVLNWLLLIALFLGFELLAFVILSWHSRSRRIKIISVPVFPALLSHPSSVSSQVISSPSSSAHTMSRESSELVVVSPSLMASSTPPVY